MSKFKYELVSLEELNKMSFGEVQKTEFYGRSGFEYLPVKLDALVHHAGAYELKHQRKACNLYTRKKVEWWENIPEHGVHVWNDKSEVYLVEHVIGVDCFCNGMNVFNVHSCTPLTNEEIIELYCGGEG